MTNEDINDENGVSNNEVQNNEKTPIEDDICK